MGPAPVSTDEGSKQYYENFVDASINLNWLFLFSLKSDLYNCVIKFNPMAENQCGHKIREFQSDNAKEFLKFMPMLLSYGIVHRLACPHTHQQIGKVE